MWFVTVAPLCLLGLHCFHNLRRDGFRLLSTHAVTKECAITPVETPHDIPDDTLFYVMTYCVNRSNYKVARNSVTVPTCLKQGSSVPGHVMKRALCGQFDVTAYLRPYTGVDGDFVGNEVPWSSILRYEGCDVDTSGGLTVYTCRNTFFARYIPLSMFSTIRNSLNALAMVLLSCSACFQVEARHHT